jgi:Competence protein
MAVAPEGQLRRPEGRSDGRTFLRGCIVALTLAETAVFVALVILALSESGGWRIMRPVATIAAVPYFGAVLPALILALAGRLLWLASLLSIGVLVAGLVLWMS